MFVGIVTIPLPAARVSLPHSLEEPLQVEFEIFIADNVLQVLTNFLIDGLAGGAEFFARALDELLIYRKRYIHKHSICAHIYCVNLSSFLPL